MAARALVNGLFHRQENGNKNGGQLKQPPAD